MTAKLDNNLIRDTLRRLLTQTDACVQAESDATRDYEAATAAAEKAYTLRKQEVQKQWEVERTTTVQDFQARRTSLETAFTTEAESIEKEFASATEEITQLYERDEAAATKELKETSWTAEAIYDSQKKKAKEAHAAAKRTASEQRQTIVTLRADVADQLATWEQAAVGAPAVVDIQLGSASAAAEAGQRIADAKKRFEQLKKLVAPALLMGDRLLYLSIGFGLLVATAVGLICLVQKPGILVGLVITLVGASLAAGLLWLAGYFVLGRHARNRVRAICSPLHLSLAEAESLIDQGETRDYDLYKAEVASEKEKFKNEQRTADKNYRTKLAAALSDRDAATRRAVARREERQRSLDDRRLREMHKLEEEHRLVTKKCEDHYGGELTRLSEEHQRQRSNVQKQFDDRFAVLSGEWQVNIAAIKDDLAAIAEQDARYFPNWHTDDWSRWQPPAAVPPAVRFGEFTVSLPALPRSQRLEKPPADVSFPALIDFPVRGATMIRASGADRELAGKALLSTAVRFLTSLPAGKVRLTVIDPVGLGESYAALMHLADYDPQLVGARIWTESQQIEKRLSDLTAHMENVIQKYLRSQYGSIEEYNVQAGEVAEPYRVLVIANFPANFSTEAARRLERIAASGASCGVFTLFSYDPALPRPQGFDTADLERSALRLTCEAGRFVWDDSDFGPYTPIPDSPPTTESLKATIDRIGAKAKDANRVEVDFNFIAPPHDAIWRADSRGGIDVPLGRAGATKRQHLQLGKGTAQHVVVAGKTGSGKSTLLHALITNLALTYSPREVELYLIDFKKGVEFKTYASHRLPHARVIAVESEREFGLSVLQRLDAELKRRGDLYRQAGAQDLKGYRGATGAELPRILLIVDEFQEFFVEDDRVAQEAALLLDRLVRQGRAFGLHVMLGSQTLGGAYSLARSTIDQMAVRIALQCSEADAGLILSKDNNAARLLSRPGEAIYNDANGLIEGNDIFQVVWLNDDRREHYLTEVRRLADADGYVPPAPLVVFEGNVPSDLPTMPPLVKALAEPRPATPPRELQCWLGDAMAIKAPTAAVFRRQSASHLLMLGQQPEPARALFLAVAIASLAQQPSATSGSAPRVVLIDATPADDPLAGYFAASLGRLPGAAVFTPREAQEACKFVADEFEQRQSGTGEVPPALLFLIYGLQRIKDLRKPDDDFGFRRSGDGEPSPAQRLAALLRDGPTAGIHVVAWCDTLVNLQRSLERSALREFEMKVLFQMGANDSSTLIDSPAASRLGVNRALFAHEELTAPEKFRPFSLPSEKWLEDVARRLAGGASGE